MIQGIEIAIGITLALIIIGFIIQYRYWKWVEENDPETQQFLKDWGEGKYKKARGIK